MKKAPAKTVARKIKPLRAHDHINKVRAQATQQSKKFQPKLSALAGRKTVIKKEIPKMTAESKAGATPTTGGSGASAQEQPPDPRVVELVEAMVPPSMDPKAAEGDEKKKLAEDITKQVEAAAKKAGAGGPGSVPYAKGAWPPESDVDAAARFFAGDVLGGDARRMEQEREQKQAEQLQAAYKAAGQTPPAKGSPEEKAAAGQQGFSHKS